MGNFDWQDYDESPIFKQGIAVVKRGGKFGAIMVGGKELVPPIYDDLSEFENGYATVKWNNETRIVNLSGQIQVLKDGKEIFLPEEYDWGFDFVENLCVVVKNNKYGIVNAELKLIIPCEYEYIETLSDCLFKFREGGKWGVVDKSRKLIAEADYINITYETESLLMVETRAQNGSCTESRYGLLDCKGNVVISAECKTITKVEQGNNIFFIAEKNYKKGVLDKNGNIIVPFIYSYISDKGSPFYYHYRKRDICGFYKSNGEHYIYIDKDLRQSITIPTDYEYAEYVGHGMVKVSKADKWGLIDMTGQIIVETKFDYIDKFDGSFAKVSFKFEEKYLYGLIDTSGDIVLPIEYEGIEKWDNGYYVVRKDGLYGLLSPTLQLLINPCKEYLSKLDERYIYVKERSDYSTTHLLQGLIDYFGNEIVPAYKNISKVEVLDNAFLKVIYHRSEYKGCSRIGILNNIGKEIYYNGSCDDITYIDNGMLLIKSGHKYNIANLQGKVLFNNYYDYIEILENGDFLIKDNRCYGLARYTGEIYIHPKYTNKIKFENGIAEIKISDNKPLHKINKEGQVIVSDENKNEVIIPKDYYWGTDFINGISIVRSVKNDKLGVINKQSDVLITPEFDTIDLMSDKTLLVAKYNYHRDIYYYGLYDINGKCIFPAIFKFFEYLDNNRIRVVWNLDETHSWSLGEHKPGPNKYLWDGAEYLVNNRSALCDTQGNIISNKNLVCVQTFNNGYARSSLTLYIKDNQVYLGQVGIIDINGQTIVPPDYDGIVLYDHFFALLRKGEKYGIADLKNRKTILFNDINIKKPESVDSFGRFIYTDGDCNNQTNNKGVIGPKGIIVPSGKYSHIELLKNGLIEVSNEENTLYGLLNLKGKELLKMEFSYISSFNYGYATVCIGGYYEEDILGRELVGGKWGIIDKTGKIIVECIHDEKQELSAEDIIKYNLIDDSEFDSYGRLLFHDWEEINRCNTGVIGRNGIIIPIGKYTNIQLLENGLIKVSNEEEIFDRLGGLYGLLDADGKELLEMKYSYISEFKDGYASICIGGHNGYLIDKQHVGGKWGIIDKTGKIIVECIHDEEQPLIDGKNIAADSIETPENNLPKILCSDYIPNSISEEVGYYGNSYYDVYDDDTSSVYDNPYYNDNLDMDQQSIEFWNNL